MKNFLFAPEEQVLWDIKLYGSLYSVNTIDEMIRVFESKAILFVDRPNIMLGFMTRSMSYRQYNILLKHCK